MLDIANAYVARHGDDRLAAAAEMVGALRRGEHPHADYGYPLDLAVLAVIDAFELTPHETIHLVARLCGAAL